MDWLDPVSSERSQNGVGLKALVPVPLVVNATWKIGLSGLVALVSVIMPVQVVGLPTTTGFGAHDTTPFVESTNTFWATIPSEEFSGSTVPVELSTSRHTFDGEATLLRAQPRPPTGPRWTRVCGVRCRTWYVIVNSKPEHGVALHSLSPELSTVETSTTSGPLTVLGVHVPF